MRQNALGIVHGYLKQFVRPGDHVVDATAGNGHDTLFLAELVGESGQVDAFDIQSQAIRNTRARLEQHGVENRVRLFLEGHQNMKEKVVGPVRAVVFNFGYLPGGDHTIGTRANTSIAAIQAAMELIEDDGCILLAIYYGGDSGFEERDALLAFLKKIDNHAFSVLYHDFINYPNCPPLAVLITKSR